MGDELLLARGNRAVRNARDARVSLHHAAAVTLLHGVAGVREFEPECVADPEMVAFRAKVGCELDAKLPSGAATVVARLKAGNTISATVLHARGSIERPMSDAEIADKARSLAERSGARIDFDKLADLLWGIDGLPKISALLQATAPTPR